MYIRIGKRSALSFATKYFFFISAKFEELNVLILEPITINKIASNI